MSRRAMFAGRQPMRVAVFASGSGGNFLAACRLTRAVPDLLRIVLLFSDRPHAGVVQLAAEHDVPSLTRDFTAECGRASDCHSEKELASYRARARAFHDRVDDQVREFESRRGAIDFVVFSYARWVEGRLLEHFHQRIINQHPGDLTVLDGDGRRRLTGNNPVFEALRIGMRSVRTSTFVVDEGHDTGPIVCQGPPLEIDGRRIDQMAADELERRQKRHSDWPSLICALTLIGRGVVEIDDEHRWPDGSAQVRASGNRLPFGGIDVEKLLRGGPGPLTEDIWKEVRHNIEVAADPARW